MLNFRIEKRLIKKTGKAVIGMDEAGRGPIAGPIAVGALLMDKKFFRCFRKNNQWWQKVTDSKRLSPQMREKIYRFIKKNLSFGVGMVSAKFIDRHGLRKSLEDAAKKALKMTGARPEIILLDGNRKFLKLRNCTQRTIVKGDKLLFSIACASIVAKVTRDRYMVNASRRYVKYYFQKHKGYGTVLHLKQLKRHGPCPLHRFSFAPLKNLGFQKSFSRLKRGTGLH